MNCLDTDVGPEEGRSFWNLTLMKREKKEEHDNWKLEGRLRSLA